jgi:hypothetical protein
MPSDTSFERSLGIPLHLKKKSYEWLRTFREQICKTVCAKMWARKNKNSFVSGFFTKIVYDQVMNFIPVKVPTLYTYIQCDDKVRNKIYNCVI